MDIDNSFIATMVSMAALIVTIIALVLEIRGQRLALQINILLDLSKQLDSAQMRFYRKKASIGLLKKKPVNDELSDVLGFLSTVAVLYERKAIDNDLTYREFSYWMISYWFCSQEYVKNERAVIPNLWVTLEKAVQNMLSLEKKAARFTYDNNVLEKFLKEESRLIIKE
jgi:hypothetical protein